MRVRLARDWLRARCEPVEAALRAVSGVRSVKGSPVTGSVLIDYDPFVLAEEMLLDQVDLVTAQLDAPVREDMPAGVRSAGAERVPEHGVPLLQLMGASAVLAGTCLPIPGAGLAGLVLATEMPVLLRAASAVQQRRFEGTVLEAAALLLMVGRGNYVASALLGWLRSLGEFIVATSVTTTRRSLRELVAEPDQTVTRLEDGQRRRVPVTAVVPGDVVSVEAGERLAVDGTVVDGEALVNQQSVTGEALPVERRPGDAVFAATTLDAGRVDVRVARVGLETAVGRIVEAVEAAAREKSDIQVFAERLADRDVARTLALAALGAAFSRSLDAGTAIMVADYGLAARVGIPTAMLRSIKLASSSGILVKGPTALENLARVDTVVFDKTGTLTSGTPRIARIVSYRAGLDERELARVVAAAEHGFGHPVARAVARYAAELGIDVPATSDTAESVGLGVAVTMDGRRVLVGSRRFMDARGIALGAASRDEAAAHAVGAAPVFVAIDGHLAGMLVLQDELRPDAPAAVAALRARRMRNVIMLSGDHPEPSRVIASSLGLRHHYADLLPEDKARLIRELKAEGRVVAMVGDGINDALALREADVGIAVPGGAAVATEAADVVLLSGGLERVVRALDLSAEAIARVRRTLEIASRANLVVVGLVSFGLARPVASILLSHGTTVAAALITAAGPGAAPGSPQP